MRRIGLFGGTFNPVHCGHLLAAESAQTQLELDELRFIPAAQSPFKSRPAISDQHRIAMLELAIAGKPTLTIDTRELQRQGHSYTIDTLTELTRECPGDRLYLLLGIDAWEEFEHWKQWQKISELCHLVVLSRPGYSSPALSISWQKKQLNNISILRQAASGRLIFLTVPASEAASSKIRKRVKQGLSTMNMLDKSIQQYIETHQLYR